MIVEIPKISEIIEVIFIWIEFRYSVEKNEKKIVFSNLLNWYPFVSYRIL